MPVRKMAWRYDARRFFFHDHPFFKTPTGEAADKLLRKKTGDSSWKDFFDVHPKITKEFSGLGIASAVAGLVEEVFFGAHGFAQSRNICTVENVGTYTTAVFNPLQWSSIAYPVGSASDAVNATGPKSSATVKLWGLKATHEYDLEFAEDCLFDQLRPAARSLGQALLGQEMTDFVIPLIKDQSAGVTSTPSGQSGVAIGDLAASAETSVVTNNGLRTIFNMTGALAKAKFMPPYAVIMNSVDQSFFQVPGPPAATAGGVGTTSPTFDFTTKIGNPGNGFMGYSPTMQTYFWMNEDIGAKATAVAIRSLALAVAHEVDIQPYVYKGTIQLNGYLRSGAVPVGQAGSKVGPLGVQRTNGALT